MQNILLLSIALSMLVTHKPQHNITGRFEGLRNDTIIVQSCDVADILRASINPDLYIRQDTLVIREGKLDIDWPVEQATYFTVCPLQTYMQIRGDRRWFQDVSAINFFLDKGEKVELEVEALDSITMNYTLTGSELNRRWSAIRAQILPSQIQSTRIAIQRGNATSKQMEALTRTATSTQLEQLAIRTKYIRENPEDALSGYLFSQLPIDTAAVYLRKITPEVRSSIFAPVIDHITTRIEVRQTRQRAKEQIKEGAEAPDFTLKTSDEKNFTLSSLRGKYVVLDFWGSWCGWCIKGLPELKKHYAKHAGKFEIVGIACNDTLPKWKAAVANNALPWINVINPKAQPADQDLIIQYGIRGFPTKIILAPDGQIVAVSVGENPEFYKKLDSLLK